MHAQSPHRIRAPDGLAFPVHELVFVRAWAEGQGLTMTILVDRVLEGAEFEEMLLVRSLLLSGATLTLWRAAGGGVVAQAEGGSPRVFGGIHAALSHASALFTAAPPPGPSAWRRLLGWARA